MIGNRYTFRRRIANRLHDLSPFFHFLKRVSRPFKARRLRRKIAGFALPASPTEPDPPFTSVEIETINRCNGKCGFCPVGGGRDTRPLRKMDRNLFQRIIDELASMRYGATVCLFSNNEPLLDDRIHEFAEYARVRLPSALINMSTNGTLLTVEKYKEIIENVDLLVVNNYCGDYKLRPNLEALEKHVDSQPELWKKTVIQIRYENEVMTTRGGQAPNAHHKPKAPINVGCRLPTSQMIIRPDGKLSLCCNDALGTVTIGDVDADGLAGAWNGEAARAARRDVMRSRTCFEICKGCDTMY